MDPETLLRESRAEGLLKPLAFKTEAGTTQFKAQLRQQTANLGVLHRRQQTILHLRKSLSSEEQVELEGLFAEVARIEPDLAVFFKRTEVESESYEQLLFSGWPSLQVLNTIPFVLLALSIFKQYIVPALAVFTPLFMIIMPYFVLTYWYNMVINPQQYGKIVLGVLGLQAIDLSNPRTIVQGAFTLVSLGNSIYQPIQSALHLQTIHADLIAKARSAQRFVQICKQLETRMSPKIQSPLADVEMEDEHRLFATFWDSPFRLRLALQFVGDCEVLYRLSTCDSLSPVQLVSCEGPCLTIVKGVDPFLSSSVPYTLRLAGSKHHAILTGPNRGGKSSVLRSTLLTVVMAQAFGLGYCQEDGWVRLRPFDWIATGLRLEDRPGTTSMFEREVEFAIQILKTAKQYPEKVGLVLFDELFHSTNPPDGARTAEIFLSKLWETPNTASFISTHVFSLAKKAHSRIQKLCVPAVQHSSGFLEFSYTLKEGICEVSSVDLILKEKGLLHAEKSTPENPVQ